MVLHHEVVRIGLDAVQDEVPGDQLGEDLTWSP